MDHDGVVSRPNLDFGHFIDDISDGLEVRTFPVWSPVHNVELGHLVGLTRLQWWGGGTYSLYSTLGPYCSIDIVAQSFGLDGY